MCNWAAEHIQARHDLGQRFLAGEDSVKMHPIVSDDLAEFSEGREVDFLLRAKRYTRVDLSLDVFLYVILDRLRDACAPPVFTDNLCGVKSFKMTNLFLSS